MTFIDPQILQEAQQMDVLTYLQRNNPENLVRLSENYYYTKDHDSLKISNGKWYWFSRGIGGVSALDYLMKVQDYSFIRAVEAIIGRKIDRPSYFNVSKPAKPRKLLLPDVEKNPVQVTDYLRRRGIHSSVINYCLEHALLFETNNHHNAMFVGYDVKGIARYAALRSINSGYKGEVTGSNKHFSFSMSENYDAEHVHLFESAIDAMSYASLAVLEGSDWKQDTLLSLAGVFQVKRANVVPVALQQYLEDHSQVKVLHLHLDNDEVGRGATAGIMKGLSDKYQVLDEPPKKACKDMNDELMLYINTRKKEEYER